jgi:hypothetical protein
MGGMGKAFCFKCFYHIPRISHIDASWVPGEVDFLISLIGNKLKLLNKRKMGYT